MRFLAFDCETTRVFNDASRHRIVELYSATMEDPRAQVWSRVDHWVLDPGVAIPASATAVHGFDDASVAGKPTFPDIAAEVQALIGGAVLCAFNGRKHDFPLLDRELKRAGQPGLAPDQLVLDPYELLCEQWPRTLAGALRIYELGPNPRPHSAEWDVRSMLKVVQCQLESGRPWGRHRFPDDFVKPWQATTAFRVVDGQAVFSFGKHAGQPVSASHAPYLKWMLGADFPDAVKAQARGLLAGVGA